MQKIEMKLALSIDNLNKLQNLPLHLLLIVNHCQNRWVHLKLGLILVKDLQ